MTPAQLSNRTAWLIGAAVVVRFAACAGTLSGAGPLLGLGTLALMVATGSVAPVAMEYAVGAVLIVAGTVIGIAVAGGSTRSRAALRMTAWFIIADTAIYLTSLAIGMPLLVGLGQIEPLSPVALLTGPILVANAALLTYAIRVLNAAR